MELLKVEGQIMETLDNSKKEQAEKHGRRGFKYLMQSKFKQAEQAFKEAIKLNPDYEGIHTNLGTVYAAQGKLENALPEFQEALKNNLHSAELNYNVASCLDKMGRYSEAVEYWMMYLLFARELPEGSPAHRDAVRWVQRHVDELKQKISNGD